MKKTYRFPRALRTLLWVLLAVSIVIVALLAAAPSFISSQYGKEWTLNQINKHISGHLKIDDLKLSWISGQKISGFSLEQKTAEKVLTFDHFSTDASLFSLITGPIFHRYQLGETTLTRPFLQLIENEEGELTLKEALSSKKKKLPKLKKLQSSQKKRLPRLEGNIQISDGEIFLSAPKIEPILISSLNIEVRQDPDVFHITGKTKQGKIEGNLAANGAFQKEFRLILHIDQLPVAILDQWEETSLFTEGLGKTLSLDIELVKTLDAITFSSTIQSPLLKGSFTGTTRNGHFVMDPNGKAVWTLTPTFFKQIIEKSAAEKWQLATKTDVQFTLQQLEFPFSLKKLQWDEIFLSGKATIDRAEITHSDLGHFSLNQFSSEFKTLEGLLQASYLGHIQGKAGTTQMEGTFSMDSEQKITFGAIWKSFPVDLFQLAADETIYLKTLVGPTLDLATAGTYDKKLLNATIDLTSNQATLQGTIQSANAFEDIAIDLSGEVNYPQKYRTLLGPSPHVVIHADASLLGNTFAMPFVNATFQNPYWTFNLRGRAGEKGTRFSFDQLQLVGVGSIHNLPIESQNMVVEEGSFYIQIEGAQNEILADLQLQSAFKDQSEKRSAEATVHIQEFIQDGKLDLKNAKITSKGNFERFPVAILNPFVGPDINLATLFGSFVNFDYNGSYTPKAPEGQHKATLDLHVNGQDFHGIFSIALDGTLTVYQNKPAFLNWELTPARYQTLMRLLRPDQEPAYVLTRGAKVDLTIHQLTCPTTTSSNLASFLCQSGFKGDLKIGPMHFKSRKGTGEMALLDITSSIEGENFSQAIQFKGKGKIVSPTIPEGEQSGFFVEGALMGFWSPEGMFNRQGTVQGELSLDLLPVREFTGILPINEENRQKIQAILGPLVNARIYGEISQLTGPLTVDIKSSNLKAIFPIYMHGNYITLQKTVEAELTLTEAINEIFLKDAIPILITGAWSDHPIRIFLDAEGFILPFQPFSLQRTQISHGVIDLGKLRVRNRGNIQTLVEFLKAKEATEEGMMEAWFTPIFFTLKDGVASYKRFDALLAGSIHIALWGKIDLIRDKVKMILGIGPTTLQQRYNIKGISKKEMFQVKMRGTTSNVELDWSSAYTRIGLLITRSTGGHIGYLVGGILEQLLGNMGDEETPPQTTYPFPWENSGRGLPYSNP